MRDTTPKMTAVEEANVLGVSIRRRARQDALATLHRWLEEPGPHSVYFVHAATANLAFEDAGYRVALNRGHLVLNDGLGMRWAARVQGLVLEENLVGTDLLPRLLWEWGGQPLRIYLLGGRPGIPVRAARYLQSQFPAVAAAGCCDGYFSETEVPRLIRRINRAEPDLLLVGLGNPRQELFLDRHLPELRCRVAVGVGGLFDHWAGELRRAAPWVQRAGLEWAQLLAQQPHKWRRYLLGNPKFLWRAAHGAWGRG